LFDLALLLSNLGLDRLLGRLDLGLDVLPLLLVRRLQFATRALSNSHSTRLRLSSRVTRACSATPSMDGGPCSALSASIRASAVSKRSVCWTVGSVSAGTAGAGEGW
jgi:hypothetical protein